MTDNRPFTQLPDPEELINRRHLPLTTAECYSVPGYGIEAEQETTHPLTHYFWILKHQWWKILAFVTLCVVATAIVSKRITPVYESTVTIDIDRQTPLGIVGEEATRALRNDSDQFLATQITLIQSDSVLRPVVEKYHLRNPHETGTRAVDAPVHLKSLKVTRPPNTYLLLISYRSTAPGLAAAVANAVSQSYVEHTYNIRIRSSSSLSSFMEKQLEELRAKMEQSSAALAQFEKELNVINPEEKTNILSARLLQLNTEYTNAQADRVRKEAAFSSVKTGSLEAAQVSTQGEALKGLTEKLEDVQQKFADVKAHYGAGHPEYRRTASQLAEVQRQLQSTRDNIGHRVEIEYRESLTRESMLKNAVAETKAEFDRLNARSFEYQSLKREAEADKKLYEELVRKIREAGINAGFQNSSIRIADTARPADKPVFPNLPLNLALAFVFSSFLSVSGAVVADMLNNTIRDPEHIARTLNTEVVGSLPRVKDWKNALLSPLPSDGATTALVPVTSSAEPRLTSFDEAIRTLRNSIFLADFDRRLRSLMITSAAPAEGKSTIAANLATAHAQQGHKTLLIDADLRRPSLHRRFTVDSKTGLSEVLNAEIPWREAVTHVEMLPNLDLLLAGPPSRRAADLIGIGLGYILEEAGKQYDFIIVDSPPLLGFPEPMQMAALVDGVLVVAMEGHTQRTALRLAVTTLARLRANLVGVVLNSVEAGSNSGYYYHYNSKYYKDYRDVAAAR